MDSEWDRHVAMLLVAGDKTHAELEELGIDDKDLTPKFDRMNSIIQELQNTRLAATDMVELQLKAKLESLQSEMLALQQKLEKVRNNWDEDIIQKAESTLKDKEERISTVREKLEQKTLSGIKSFQRAINRKAVGLAKEHRLQRRNLGSGRKGQIRL